MKQWSPDHPQAKLMDRKRAAILSAAREAFLDQGYEGTSMEGIAAKADVSIMTLYRHVGSKDELFSAVIAHACDPGGEAEAAEFERLMFQPLEDVLFASGMVVQHRLTDRETVALMRVVIAESERFPALAERAYQGLIGHLQDVVESMLAAKAETRDLSAEEHQQLSKLFIDQLCGVDTLRMLFGLDDVEPEEQERRAKRASAEVVEMLHQRSPALPRSG